MAWLTGTSSEGCDEFAPEEAGAEAPEADGADAVPQECGPDTVPEECGTANVPDQRRQQLLQALNELPNFSWRPPSVEPSAEKHRDTLQEMRRRMAEAMRVEPEEREFAAEEPEPEAEVVAEPKVEEIRRQEFLRSLSHNFDQIKPACTETPTIEGDDFFAELDELRDRIKWRKANSRLFQDTTSCGVTEQDQHLSPPANSAKPECKTEQSTAPWNLGQRTIPLEDLSRSSQPEDEPSLDELSGGDELLRWAEEVLRKAKAAEKDSQSGYLPQEGTANQHGQQGRAQMHSQSHVEFESAQQKRAEEFRDAVNRMTEEAEAECQRLSAAGEQRRRHFAAHQAQWQTCFDSTFEEIRSDFAHASSPFRRPVPPSHPPPQRPKPRPTGARQTSRSQEADCHQGLPESVHDGKGRQETPDRAEDEAWRRLEERLAEGPPGRPISFKDIPWPAEDDRKTFGLGRRASISGVTSSHSAAAAKQLLARALRRWHPDKWRRILDRVPAQQQEQVMERVKSVAQKLLEEKAQLTAPGGVLHQI